MHWYCKCQSGNRTIGCCSHICAVLLYLGHSRFEPLQESCRYADQFMDAAEAVAACEDLEDTVDGTQGFLDGENEDEDLGVSDPESEEEDI